MNTKSFFLVISFFLISITYSQTSLKFNAATALLGIPNIGFETTLSKKFTFQFDATASFWKSVNNAPIQFLLIIPEFRYYTKEAGKGFFVGAHIGGGAFKIQKWTYRNTDLYEEGYTVLYGVTLGYQFIVSPKFNLEVFAGGGSSQGFYKGYYISTNERYDFAKDYNKSGEIIPYRGGLMLVYKLGSKNER